MAAPAETPEYRQLRDHLVILLVNSASLAAVEHLCGQRGLGPEVATRIIAEARGRIAVAAHIVHTEQVGTAVLRLNDDERYPVEEHARVAATKLIEFFARGEDLSGAQSRRPGP